MERIAMGFRGMRFVEQVKCFGGMKITGKYFLKF